MDIFENQQEVFNNIKDSAKNLGIKEEVVKEIRKEIRGFAKKSCKKCYGRGGFNHIAPDGKQGTLRCTCVRFYEVQVVD
jgi:hypothetical protein